METDLILPAWFLYIVPAVAAWGIWATVALFKNKSAIEVNDERDNAFRELITEKFGQVKNDVTEIKAEFKSLHRAFTDLSGQIVGLLTEEVKALKGSKRAK